MNRMVNSQSLGNPSRGMGFTSVELPPVKVGSQALWDSAVFRARKIGESYLV
jgi:hypothetical protein